MTLLNAFLWVLWFQDIVHINICNVKGMWMAGSVYVLASWTKGLCNWLKSVLLKQDKYLWTIQNPLFWNVKCGPSGAESSRCFLSAFGVVSCCSGLAKGLCFPSFLIRNSASHSFPANARMAKSAPRNRLDLMSVKPSLDMHVWVYSDLFHLSLDLNQQQQQTCLQEECVNSCRYVRSGSYTHSY